MKGETDIVYMLLHPNIIKVSLKGLMNCVLIINFARKRESKGV